MHQALANPNSLVPVPVQISEFVQITESMIICILDH